MLLNKKAYLCHVYSKFGGSEKILSDNGTEFKNKLFEEVADELGVEYKVYTLPYRPLQKCLANSCCYINVRNSVKFCCFPCKYLVFMFANHLGLITMVQFWRKTQHFVHRGFILQGPHKEFAVYSISYQSDQICVFCQHYSCLFGKFHCFPCKNELLAPLLRVFCKILLISPQIWPSNAYRKCYGILLIKSNAFRSIQIFSIKILVFCYQTLLKCYKFVLLRALACFVSKHDW